MATHSSVLAWRIPRTGKPGGLLSMGSQSRTWLKWLSSSRVSHRGKADSWESWFLSWSLMRFQGSVVTCQSLFNGCKKNRGPSWELGRSPSFHHNLFCYHWGGKTIPKQKFPISSLGSCTLQWFLYCAVQANDTDPGANCSWVQIPNPLFISSAFLDKFSNPQFLHL